MTDNSLGNFDDLLDPDFQDHVIEVMKGWCTGKYSTLDSSRADLIETQISEPLKFWINETLKRRKSGNYSDIESANAFAIKSDNIVYILRYKTRPLYPEHVSILNDAWSDFQRSIAYNLHIRIRVLSEIIDRQPDLSATVDKEIKRRDAEEAKQKEELNRAAKMKWQKAGAEAAIKYNEDDEKKWHKAGKEILGMSNGKISIRGFARQIQKELGYPDEARETIRKTETIINLVKEHNLKNNSG